MSASEQNRPARNILLRLAYDGTDFMGWQIQPGLPTIQGTLNSVIEQVCGEQVHVSGSGRTDAGVHACEQAANVPLHSPIPCPNLVRAANKVLPDSIRILSAQQVRDDFHARRHAESKVYRYRIFRGGICSPLLCRYVLPYPYPLDENAMEQAAKHFQGTHDFRSFAAADEDQKAEARSSVRTVLAASLSRQGDELIFTIQGNGFLRHMVRNIVGTLIDVGRGRTAADEIPAIIAARNRSAAGPTAPGRGLHLVTVSYPAAMLQYPSPGQPEPSR